MSFPPLGLFPGPGPFPLPLVRGEQAVVMHKHDQTAGSGDLAP